MIYRKHNFFFSFDRLFHHTERKRRFNHKWIYQNSYQFSKTTGPSIVTQNTHQKISKKNAQMLFRTPKPSICGPMFIKIFLKVCDVF